jgi:hypothetical protein
MLALWSSSAPRSRDCTNLNTEGATEDLAQPSSIRRSLGTWYGKEHHRCAVSYAYAARSPLIGASFPAALGGTHCQRPRSLRGSICTHMLTNVRTRHTVPISNSMGYRADVGSDVELVTVPGRRGCGLGCGEGRQELDKGHCGGLHPSSILSPRLVSPFCFPERWRSRPVSGAAKHDRTMTTGRFVRPNMVAEQRYPMLRP